MDHLPTVEGVCSIHLEVPYLLPGRWTYDCKGIHGFPERMNFNTRSLQQRGHLQGYSHEECLSFIQSWLFFGLVIDVFSVIGIRLQPTDFIRTKPDGTNIITSRLFPQLVIAWELVERGATQTNKLKRLKQIDSIIALAHEFINHSVISDWTDLPPRMDSENEDLSIVQSRSSSFHPTTSVKVELSILWLGETLSHARQIAYFDFSAPDSRIRQQRENFAKWKRPEALKNLLLNRGWCPFEVEYFHTYSTNSTIWYFASFSRDHEPEDHRGCTTQVCALNVLTKEEYRTRHVTEGCDCLLLHSISADDLGDSASQDTFSEIVRREHIPLALVTGSPGNDELQIVSSQRKGLLATIDHNHRNSSRTKSAQWPVYDHDVKPVIQYVAISHVWRGGLGNPKANALPRCQLSRIQALVNAQYPPELHPVPFWMDTLCVPLNDSMRKKAIAKMKSIYQEADKVLVLDTALQSAALANDALINLTRIRYCSWTQRLWTYQEGILAFQLLFQFQDKAVFGEYLIRQQESDSRKYYRENIDQIRAMIKDRASFLINAHVLLNCSGIRFMPFNVDHPWIGRGTTLPKQVDLVQYGARMSFKQVRIAHSQYSGTFLRKDRDFEALSRFSAPLQWRRTTKIKDEALVLANLMGLNLKLLLDPRRDLTLKHIFQNMEFAPVDVLFVAREHFSEPGCRWMPKSLIDGRGSTVLSNKGGKVTPNGFVVRLPGISIAISDLPPMNETTFAQIQGTLYEIKTVFSQPIIIESQQHQTETQCALVYKNLNLHVSFPGAILRNINDRSRIPAATWSGCVKITPMRLNSTVPSCTTIAHAPALIKSQSWCIN